MKIFLQQEHLRLDFETSSKLLRFIFMLTNRSYDPTSPAQFKPNPSPNQAPKGLHGQSPQHPWPHPPAPPLTPLTQPPTTPRTQNREKESLNDESKHRKEKPQNKISRTREIPKNRTQFQIPIRNP
ncbi:hypothetical protein LR48_Vigan03g061700 [Vigna angularis]|uniref:Uncharacterized protein n=1 Tax=Phaseolus angularis TaxID=3914 RepID=A0A0L9U384_PHAAN|nr:hypothetical protein LR48_Vigan03g061700 [Vigna angularis]